MKKIKGLLLLKGIPFLPYPRPSAAKQSPKQSTQIRVEINVYKTHVPSNYILLPAGGEGDSELVLLNKSH